MKFKQRIGLVNRDSISFMINGVNYSIDNQFPLTMTLNEYLRDVLNMTG